MSVEGNRNIFRLQSTIHPEKPAKNDQVQSAKEEEDGDERIQDTAFDIDFAKNDFPDSKKKSHIFSQIQVSRGWEDDSEQVWDPNNDPSLRQRRQSARTKHFLHK